MTERWALAPAEDGGAEIAALGPDGLPAGPVRREADLAEAVRDPAGREPVGVAVDRRGLSATARHGGASRAVLRHRGRRDAAARTRGAARRAPVGGGRAGPAARRPRAAGSAAAVRRTRFAVLALRDRGPVPRAAGGSPRGLRRPAAPARGGRAPGADAAADGRRVGGDAGGRRDEPRPGCRGARTSTATCCTNCSASGTRAAVSRGGSPSWRTRCRAAFGRRVRPDLPADVVKAFAQAGIKVQVDPAVGDRGDRPSGGEAADRVQEAVPDLGRARLVLAPGLGARRPVPARVPAGRDGHRALGHQRRRRRCRSPR